MDQLEKLEEDHRDIKRPAIWFDLTPIFTFLYKKIFKKDKE